MILNSLIPLLLLFFVSIENTKAAFDEVDFYDVGQGHCVVAHSKNGTLVIDAGSSSTIGIEGIEESSDDKYDILANKIFKSIQRKVKQYTSDSGSLEEPVDLTDDSVSIRVPVVNFIITHADKDHLNLSNKIATKFNNVFNRRNVSIKFILGGDETEYSSGESQDLLKFIKDEKIKSVYGSNFNFSPQKSLLWNLPDGFNFEFGSDDLQFLSTTSIVKKAPAGLFKHKREQTRKIPSEQQNKNASSIVVRIIGKNGSVMITGDKTKEEINEIISLHTRYNRSGSSLLKSDILLATHHGSEEDFSSEWMRVVRPDYLVVSCGISSYNHPRHEAVLSRDVLRNLSFISGTPWHPIRSYGRLDTIEINHNVIPVSSGKVDDDHPIPYSYAMTNFGIYITADQGNINFFFDERSGVKVTTSKNGGDLDQGKALYNFLISYNDTWSDLLLPPMIFSDDRMLDEVIKKCSSLKNLDLRYCEIKDEIKDATKIAEKILSQLTLLPSMNLRNVRGDALINEEENKEKIRKAWGYRGLNL